MIALLLLSGCKKSVSMPTVSELTQELQAPSEKPEVYVGSGTWRGRGLQLYVPPDWAGREGPEPRVLGLLQASTGTEIELYALEQPIAGPRSALTGCTFVSRQGYRAVPLLGRAHTATCESEGRVRQVWWGMFEGKQWHVEVLYPERGAVAARQAVTPLLEGLTPQER